MNKKCKWCFGEGCHNCDYIGSKEETRAEIDLRVLKSTACACGKCYVCQSKSMTIQETVREGCLIEK